MPKTLIELLREPIPVDENMEDYSNEPIFLKRAEEAAQFMRDHPYEPEAESLTPKTISECKSLSVFLAENNA